MTGPFKLYFGLLVFSTVLTTGVDGHNCTFEELSLECDVFLENTTIKAHADINTCHKPVDVTFVIKAGDPVNKFTYTFVTTNPKESHEVITLGESSLFLLVDLSPQENGTFDICAAFRLDWHEWQWFINTTANITSVKDKCYMPALFESASDSHIAFGIIATSILTCTAIAVFLWRYRRKQLALERSVVVDDAIAGVSGAIPYLEGAASKGEQKKIEKVIKVPYCSTVIQNDFACEDGNSSDTHRITSV